MFSVEGVLRSTKDNSEVRCWVEHEGALEVLTLKLMGVIMLVVGVNPVEVNRLSKPRLATTLDGVSMVMPAMAELASAAGGEMLRVKGRFGFNPPRRPRFEAVCSDLCTT